MDRILWRSSARRGQKDGREAWERPDTTHIELGVTQDAWHQVTRLLQHAVVLLYKELISASKHK